MQALKDRGCFVVNFEDLGEGAEVVDVVINALYEDYRKKYLLVTELLLLT